MTKLRYPDPERSIEQQDELVLLAMLIWGEARGESSLGKLAVANVVRNRVLAARRGYGLGFREVCLKPWQFSCFNANDPNRAKMLAPKRDEVWVDCFSVAADVYEQRAHDNTERATHYHVAGMTKLPKWAELFTPTVLIGRHQFYRAEAMPPRDPAASLGKVRRTFRGTRRAA